MASAERVESSVDRLMDLAFVGPRTAEQLADAGISPADVRGKRVSYRDLVRAGVNPGVAAKLRRSHSLHWSLDEQDADLDRRSELVRGLQDDERAWIVATFEEGTEERDLANSLGEGDGDESDSSERVGAAGGSDSTAEDSADDDPFLAEQAWRDGTR